jgi:cation:H+ antiporter
MMELAIEAMLFFVGLFILLKGASIFTQNASRIAKGLGISDIVIGLTLVAFTTSLPELAVSIASVLRGSSGIAMGNVIGSNIANVGLVLGLAALLTPRIRANRGEIRQGYIMLLVTFVSVLFIIDGLSAIKGGILVTALFFYIYYLSRDKGLKEGIVERVIEKKSIGRGTVLCIAGGAGVLVGAEMMVTAGTSIAGAFNVSETLVGLTLIAVGTSLPELAVSITAAVKRLEGIALGNIIGSNIFNLLMVMGASALAGPIIIEGMLIIYSVPMMVLLSVLLVIFMKVENRLGRADGVALLSIYAFFLYLKFFIV